MPHSALKIIPGVDTTKTFALNEAAISDCDLIRFMPDRIIGGIVQKLGGWKKFISSPIGSTIFALHAWADTNSVSRIAAGAEFGVFAGSPNLGMAPISPQAYIANVVTDFSTIAASNVVTIKDVESNITDYDAIFINTPVSVGGIVLSGYYKTQGFSVDEYDVLSTDIFGNPVNAAATVNNGGSVAQYTTTAGSLVVNVELADHGKVAGDTYAALVLTNVGGIDIYGNYVVQNVIDTDNFTISDGVAASSAATGKINNGLVQIEYFIGQKAVTATGGFGSGGFGSGGFGTGSFFGGGRQLATTGATCIGTTATVTFATPIMDVQAGTIVHITGIVPAEYNGDWVVEDSTPNSVSFEVPATLGPQTTAGTIQISSWGPFPADDWSLDNWGEDLIACPHQGTIYDWQPNTGADHLMVLPNAPIVNEGCFVAMPQRQIIAYGSTFTGIQDPLLIRWCDVGDNNSWIATVVNQAGSYRIARGSTIVGAMQGPQQSLIWTDIGLWTMNYVGPPYVYAFNEIGNGCGMVGRKAAGTLAGVVYWMGQSQFYKMAGGWPEIVPCPIWDTVFQDVSLANRQRIRCAPNSRFGEITWYFPTDDSGGEPARYVKYNSLLGQWDFGNLTRTAWIDQSVFGPPIGAGPGGWIYQHETSNDADGQPMSSYFTTGYFALSEADIKVFIDQIWPDMKWGQSEDPQTAEVNITFYATDYPGQPPFVFGPYLMKQSTKFISPRIRGRLISVEISSNDIGSFWRLGNIRYRGAADGKY